MRVRFLGQEDPLEEGMATHTSILAWRIPMDRGAWQAIVHGVAKSRTWLKWLSTELGERKGNLSDSEGGAFWLNHLHRPVATIGPCRTDKDGHQGQGQGAKRSQSRVWSGQSACQEQAPSVFSTLLLFYFLFFFPEKAKKRSSCY